MYSAKQARKDFILTKRKTEEERIRDSCSFRYLKWKICKRIFSSTRKGYKSCEIYLGDYYNIKTRDLIVKQLTNAGYNTKYVSNYHGVRIVNDILVISW
jgi:hypothetical protein